MLCLPSETSGLGVYMDCCAAFVMAACSSGLAAGVVGLEVDLLGVPAIMG